MASIDQLQRSVEVLDGVAAAAAQDYDTADMHLPPYECYEWWIRELQYRREELVGLLVECPWKHLVPSRPTYPQLSLLRFCYTLVDAGELEELTQLLQPLTDEPMSKAEIEIQKRRPELKVCFFSKVYSLAISF